MTAMVQIEKLNKSFGDLHVLRDIDLEVAQGEVVVMIGVSGSGKTTLLRCINVLEEPQSGRIFVDGEPMGVHGADGNFRAFPDRLLNERRPKSAWCFSASTCFPI